ncbi:MAG: hypothetical protein M1480_00270 [Bacteroidetes bacterium]|nr:hypothetical protein [Bacteroidota bacterium]MCL5027431.1 hypothetical protein [Bacteroidota bacterium]
MTLFKSATGFVSSAMRQVGLEMALVKLEIVLVNSATAFVSLAMIHVGLAMR